MRLRNINHAPSASHYTRPPTAQVFAKFSPPRSMHHDTGLRTPGCNPPTVCDRTEPSSAFRSNGCKVSDSHPLYNWWETLTADGWLSAVPACYFLFTTTYVVYSNRPNIRHRIFTLNSKNSGPCTTFKRNSTRLCREILTQDNTDDEITIPSSYTLIDLSSRPPTARLEPQNRASSSIVRS